MYIVVIGWLYVALMMAVAEASNTNGSVLGAIFTFLLMACCRWHWWFT